jgi:hypothetical protein
MVQAGLGMRTMDPNSVGEKIPKHTYGAQDFLSSLPRLQRDLHTVGLTRKKNQGETEN